MSLFRRPTLSHQRPDDSPDLSWMMAFVTSVGGVSAYTSRGSRAGLVAGCGVGALFAVSGALIANDKIESHEVAHQVALMGSVLFGGAMGYRAGANPYVGPGGAMLAALGGLSSAYHLAKWVEWRSFEQGRLRQAESLLRDHYNKVSEDGGEGVGRDGVQEREGRVTGGALRGVHPGEVGVEREPAPGPSLPPGGW